MSISNELDKLDELHRRGGLSDDEFARAKARVLGTPGGLDGLGKGGLSWNVQCAFCRRGRAVRRTPLGARECGA